MFWLWLIGFLGCIIFLAYAHVKWPNFFDTGSFEDDAETVIMLCALSIVWFVIIPFFGICCLLYMTWQCLIKLFTKFVKPDKAK